MSALQHGEQLKGDESVSLDDLTTCSRSVATTRKSGMADDEHDEDDSLAECEENYVITIKVPQPSSSSESKPVSVAAAAATTAAIAAAESGVGGEKKRDTAHTTAANTQGEKQLYYKPIETLTHEEFFKNKQNEEQNQVVPNQLLSDIKAKFESKEIKEDAKTKAVYGRGDEQVVVGKLPKSKVELYDGEKKMQQQQQQQQQQAKATPKQSSV
jgi:hypothetical protein